MEPKVEYSNNEGKWGCKYSHLGISAIGYSYKKDVAYNNALSRWRNAMRKKEEKNDRQN